MKSKDLIDLGLTGNESSVYISLLKSGVSSATQIIEKTGLHRAVVYDLLGRLSEKGLVSQVIIGRKKYFEASNPNRLIELLEEKKQAVQEILPSLLELSNFSEPLDIKVYRGKEGLKTVLEDLVRANPKEWLTLNSGGKTFELLPFFMTQLQKKRIKAKIMLKALMIDAVSSRKRSMMFEKDALTYIRFLPEQIKTPAVMNIYDDVVVFYNAQEDNVLAIVIKNKTFAKSFKEYFNYLWTQSKK